MDLTSEEQAILAGDRGAVLAKVLRTVVAFGELMGAEQLVPVVGGAHTAVGCALKTHEPYHGFLDELLGAGLKIEPYFTADPLAVDTANIDYSPEELAHITATLREAENTERYLALGLKDRNAFTCTCYFEEVGNRPSRGDVLAWSESSAVSYANSVLGARCNRNAIGMEMLCGIIGKVPCFGLLLDRNRKAHCLLQLETDGLPSPHLLGSLIGKRLVEDIPFIAGLDRLTDGKDPRDVSDYLKDMGAAAAAAGAVALYHVENVTPEARAAGRTLLRDGFRTTTVTDADISALHKSFPVVWPDPTAQPETCIIGCPHLSQRQTTRWVRTIAAQLKAKNRQKVGVQTILCTAPDTARLVRADAQIMDLCAEHDIRISHICGLAHMLNPVTAARPIITDSAKLQYYTSARFYTEDALLEQIT